MGTIAKFLYSKVEGNVQSKGEYIIHTRPPHCIGKVHINNGIVRVYMEKAIDLMDADQEKEMCLAMKDWYYYKYYRPAEKHDDNVTTMDVQRFSTVTTHLLHSALHVNKKKLAFTANTTPHEFIEDNRKALAGIYKKIPSKFNKAEALEAAQFFLETVK